MTDVLIADDHPVVLEGLAALLSGTRFNVTSRCANGQEVLRALESGRPDLLVLDINMPPPSGLALLKDLQGRGLAARTVLLTSNLSNSELAEALELGAGGLVLKESAARRLLQCLDTVDQGDPWFDPDVMRRLANAKPSPWPRSETRPGDLTVRELDVLRLTATGSRNKDIGVALGITDGTVKMYLHSIYQKLGVSNRVEMVNTARANGLL
jgi:two-component system, NarL family, nitrate/nitrite response regulator NarL